MMRIFGPYKRSSRSASMQLSINAIVILVMAMAVLGLGLGLIRGVLGSGKDKLLGALEGMDLSEQATSEKPIANLNNVVLKKNKDEVIAVSFYNAENSACSDSGATLTINCSGTALDGNLTTQLPSVSVPQGEAKAIGGIVKATAPSGSYACSARILCGTETTPAASGTMFIKVTA